MNSFVKPLFDFVKKRPDIIVCEVNKAMRGPINEYALNEKRLVWVPKGKKLLDKIDKFPNGGVHVLAAPPSLGRQHMV